MRGRILILFLFGCLAGAVVLGFYPVALVGARPISYRTWQKTKEASKRFINANIQSSGQGELVTFSLPEHRDELREVERAALSFLIENEILRQEGSLILPDLEARSREKAVLLVRSGGDIANAAELVYGLKAKDFKRLVLLPQARQDVLREALAAQGKNFPGWLLETKREKNIRIFFAPFEWNGEEVR